MTTFPPGFTCWKAKTVAATIPTEAATPSDEVLLATHSPLSIRREGARAGTGADHVTERDVLDEFLGSSPNAGVVVAPVLGESGTGKSHLVRWVHATMPEAEKRRIIYLPKTRTSLRDVVEELLKDQEGPVFDEIRGQVGLGASVTVEEMEHRILNELAEALRSRAPQGSLEKRLVGADGLGLLFHDPLFREHMLRPGSFIHQRARYVLEGRDPDEPDVPLEFTHGELPMDIGDSARLDHAAVATQKLFRRLATDDRLQSEAVRILNDVLEVALTKAANIGVGNISRAFMKLREELVGHEIILLIEDVALIQGVRRELLDAIIETSIVQGREKYATVRTLLAVTPGYYEKLPDTFRTRAEASSPRYVVDIELAADGAADSQLVDFVSRYLNAARVGKDKLESSMSATSTQIPPNACDECTFKASCHTIFGTSEAGYGLYPYNRSAVERAVRACADVDRNGEPARFNPRRVLARAVRDVLETAEGLVQRGEFPPADLLADEATNAKLQRLSIDVTAALQEQYPPDIARQLQTFLLFWGANGTRHPADAIIAAFGIEPLPNDLFSESGTHIREPTSTGGSPRETAGARARESTIPSSDPHALRDSVQRSLAQIDAWGTSDAVLPQAIANFVRNTIREAIFNRLQWFSPVIKPPNADILAKALPVGARSVSIEGAKESISSSVEPVIRVSRTARNAQMIMGLVLLDNERPDLSGDALARLDALVVDAIPVAQARVLAALEYDEAKVVTAARSLIEGAHVCGHSTSIQTNAGLVNALVWRGAPNRPDEDSRSPQCNAEYSTYIEERQKAIDKFIAGVGATQGSGAVHALDYERLTRIVKRVRSDWGTSRDGQQLPSWCVAAHKQLDRLIQVAPLQIKEWTQLIGRLRELLPPGVSYVETVDAVCRAADAASGLGLVPVQNLSALATTNSNARNFDDRVVARVEKVLANSEDQSGYGLACAVGTDVGSGLTKIVGFLEESARWVELGIQNGEVDQGSAIEIDDAINEQVVRWLAMVGEDGADV
ncbi:protein DpdH [Nocardia cyriacigeorgica]|uniref:protein DpdH n=1 Tax=Nocardia cyriacigeorgica TaxID=135487 RepID=UPI001893AA05|nr:protein DpdH [Nocardia cyriacigeorgica]MBF6414622.1 ATP-binding protein [Nocardia cyriacigeorgica]